MRRERWEEKNQLAQTAVDEERLGKAKVAIAELERENSWQRDVHESEARNLQNEIEKRGLPSEKVTSSLVLHTLVSIPITIPSHYIDT